MWVCTCEVCVCGCAHVRCACVTLVLRVGTVYYVGVVSHLTTEREDGDPGWEGRVVHSTGEDQSLQPTPLVAWNKDIGGGV